MNGSDYAIMLGLVVCVMAIIALVVVLVKVLDALKMLREGLEVLDTRLLPLVADLRDATDETREVIDDARDDLERFDRVLGSAEAISGAVADTSLVARTVISTPIIKAAAFVRGASAAFSGLGSSQTSRRQRKRNR